MKKESACTTSIPSVPTRSIPRSRSRRVLAGAVGLLALVYVACDGSGSTNVVGPDDGPDLSQAELTKVSGDQQEGTVGAPALEPLVAQMVDANGDPVAGAPVLWTFLQGQGRGIPSGAAGAQLPDTTDSDGLTEVEWTLGTKAGAQQATVEIDDPSSGSASAPSTDDSSDGPAAVPDNTKGKKIGFFANAKAGKVDSIDLTPDPVETPPGQTVQLDATVLDQYDNEVEGTDLQWSSSNTNVATVDDVGTATAVSEGSAEITAKSGPVQGSATFVVDASTDGGGGGGSGSSPVSNLQVASGAAYEVVTSGLVSGTVRYIDRSYTITDPVPTSVQGDVFIRTANADKNASLGSTDFLSFEVSEDVVVYVAHDDRAAIPSWLGSFTDTGADLYDSGSSSAAFSLYRKDFVAGTVTLGSNVDTSASDVSMYTVVVSGTGTTTSDTEAPTTPTNLTASAASSSSIDLAWDASTDDVGVAGYEVFRDGSRVATTSSTGYTDTGLTASTSYSYTVTAYDAAGNTSAQSESASATTFTSSDGTLEEVVIPSVSDFTDGGVAFGPSSSGWDARLSAGTPGTMVKRGPTYYAWYVGADGDRPSDGGPAHRAVGLVTSTDGVNWTKHSANPVIPWSELNANGDDEEGAWRLAVTEDADGTLLMYLTVLKGSGGSVAGPIHLFTSSDGVNWTDRGQIIDPSDGSFPGSDEFASHGAVHVDGTYHLFYGGKGSQSYALDHTSAGTPSGFTSGEELLEDADEFRYGSNPIQVSESDWIVPVGEYPGGDIRLYRTSTLGTLGTLSETWNGLAAEEGNFALYLDRETETWILLVASATNESDDDWGEVRIFTAPMTRAN